MATTSKQTIVGQIPQNWGVIKIGDIIVKSSTRNPKKKPLEEFKYVDISSVSNETYSIQSHETLLGKNAPSRAQKEIRAQDILYATVRPYLKRITIVPNHLDGEICSTGFCVVRCNVQSADPRFVFYVLQTDWMINKLTDLQEGSSYPAITDGDVYGQFIPLPPLPEQRKIAEILSTVDETIEKTDAIIQETQQLKKGLMQKLFTEGIRHTRFKETKIGRVPEEWEVLPVGQIAKDTLLGTNQTSNSRAGIPLMKMGNVAWGQFVFDKVEYVDKETAASLQGFALRDGDFLFNTRNTPELVGKSAVWKAKYGYALYNNNLLRMDFKKNIIHSTDYVSFWMNSHRGLSQLRRLVSGTTSVAAIYWKELRKYPVPVPSLEEQERITKILLEVDSKSEAETTYKLELEQLKKGLMQILLTGKVRVKV